jgi:hypothetical protein
MKQNITLSLDRELIRKAKILAAQHGTSVSSLLTRYIEKTLTEEEAYEAARKHAIGLLEHGFHLGGAIPCSRDEWHER